MAAEPPPVADLVAAALVALAPSGVRTGARAIDERDVAGLQPAERDAVATARPPRRREFATGRALLRDLLGVPDAIPRLPSRQPGWPDGVRGSLAHDHEVAVAAVSRDPAIRALGIDVELQGPLEPDEAALVLRADDGDIDPRLAFTMKEAAYKAWSSLGGAHLEHHDVRVTVEGDTYRAELLDGEVCFEGRIAAVAGRWIALVAAMEVAAR